jgi:uncharacterized membrane protein
VIFSIKKGEHAQTLIYLTILYLLFFAINIANNIRENKKFMTIEFSILLLNSSLYFAAGLYLITELGLEQFRGLFSAGLAAINLLFSYLLFKNKKVDTNILYLLIGITLTFISLAAPIQLHGHYITMFWAAESVVLFWLYQKSRIPIMKLTSLIISIVMLISLFMDWSVIYSFSGLTFYVIVNKGFITTIIAAISYWLMFKLMLKEEDNHIYSLKINPYLYQVSAIVLLFLSGLLEINHQFLNRFPDTQLNNLYLTTYVPLFILALHFISLKTDKIKFSWKTNSILIAVSILFYLFSYSSISEAQLDMLTTKTIPGLHFLGHWVGAVSIIILLQQLIVLFKNNIRNEWVNITVWLIAAAAVAFLSFEVCFISNFIFFNPAKPISALETIYIKTGLPILWGLSSFAIMWLGMRHKLQILRIVSLSLFSLTLLKLFVFDIRNIPPAGKIAAFFFLGVLLLVISFMYQKVKKIIVSNETSK